MGSQGSGRGRSRSAARRSGGTCGRRGRSSAATIRNAGRSAGRRCVQTQADIVRSADNGVRNAVRASDRRGWSGGTRRPRQGGPFRAEAGKTGTGCGLERMYRSLARTGGEKRKAKRTTAWYQAARQAQWESLHEVRAVLPLRTHDYRIQDRIRIVASGLLAAPGSHVKPIRDRETGRRTNQRGLTPSISTLNLSLNLFLLPCSRGV